MATLRKRKLLSLCAVAARWIFSLHALFAFILLLTLAAGSTLAVPPWQLNIATPAVAGRQFNAGLIAAKCELICGIHFAYQPEFYRPYWAWGEVSYHWRRDIHTVSLPFLFEGEAGTDVGGIFARFTLGPVLLVLLCVLIAMFIKWRRNRKRIGFEVRPASLSYSNPS